MIGIENLRQKLAKKTINVRLRYSIYDMSHEDRALLGVTIPELVAQYEKNRFRWYKSRDVLADRLIFRKNSRRYF